MLKHPPVLATAYKINDEKARSLEHTLTQLIQGYPGSFAFLNLEHIVQSNLQLYVACYRLTAQFLLIKVIFKIIGLPLCYRTQDL